MEDMYDQLHNPLRGYIEIEVRDREGRIVGRGRHEMRSFLNNYLKILEGEMKAIGGAALTVYNTTVASATVINTAGSSVAAWTERYAFYDTSYGGAYGGGVPFAVEAPDNDDSYGIVVGTGTLGLSLDQYAPASKIAHGTGSGQLDYGVSTYEDLGLDTGVSPPVYRFRVMRTFSNLSGAAININEVCIVARNYWKTLGSVVNDVKFLIARDVLPSTYTVPNGGSATVTVIFEVVVG
jgi:hypothetical protein